MASDAPRLIHRLAIAAIALLLPGAPPAAAQQQVAIGSLDGTRLTALLFRPEGTGPFAAVVMLHGCSGMMTSTGALKARESDWASRFVGMGYVVLLPDSFMSRGHHSICGIVDRPVRPWRERPYDAYGALRWLQAQPFIKPDKVALAGWSNGAMALLWTLRDDAAARPTELAHDFVAGVGFYPGCIDIGKTGFKAKVPVLLQVGLDDIWTLPKPCIAMVADANRRGGARMEIDGYPGAVHGFDHPNSPVKTVLARNSAYKNGEKRVRVGTNAAARDKAIARVTAYLRRALAD